ncbi:hypothetical protein BI308_25625 [Roseofilum reptotaenium AO1-A]|uniref:IS630 family transposase n=1 Tax=Roseofilum reptotaenium AO1-A TaxID=1925591 RepID=A0A1L9QFK3_9CYAN|nr:hypothetical protein BI308_25625 [Roseofilum reptotaenium AO1-A]
MLELDKSSPEFKKLQELEEFLSNSKDLREWKRGQAIKLRLLCCAYQEIRVALGVSTSFIAQILRRYRSQGISGLKLGYMGSKSFLKSEEIGEIIEWLKLPERRNVSELERHIIEEYDVVFRSRESYYKILRKANLTWQKANKENPRKKPQVIEKRNKELAAILTARRSDIEAGRLVVYALDECHLQGDEICSYVWGDKQDRAVVKVDNDRDRQTYYGALNIRKKEFIVVPYKSGNGENTVQFVEKIKTRHFQEEILLIGDGAAYHRGEEMKKLLDKYNQGLLPKKWLIACECFAPYAPEENPVEGIWLQVKNFIRRFSYRCKNFKIVKRLFQFFFDMKLFNPPRLEKYDVFAQLI